jgi:hypothetical protein
LERKGKALHRERRKDGLTEEAKRKGGEGGRDIENAARLHLNP